MEIGDKVFLIDFLSNPIGVRVIDSETPKFFKIGDERYKKSDGAAYGTTIRSHDKAVWGIKEYSKDLYTQYQKFINRLERAKNLERSIKIITKGVDKLQNEKGGSMSEAQYHDLAKAFIEIFGDTK